MGWGRRHWGARTPRPNVAKLSKEQLQQMHAKAVEFVQESVILSQLIHDVKLARGRLYILSPIRKHDGADHTTRSALDAAGDPSPQLMDRPQAR